MKVEELEMSGDTARTAAIEDAWSEVEHAGRSVDRQIECLRSILAAADAGLIEGPLGELVRGTPDYVAARGVPAAVASQLPPSVAASTQAVLAGLHAISILVSRGIDRPSVAALLPEVTAGSEVESDDGRMVDVVNGLIDDVTDRYRQVLADIASPELRLVGTTRTPTPRATAPSTTASLALHSDQLADALTREPRGSTGAGSLASVVVRSSTTWLLIAVHIAEIRGWVQAVRALHPPLIKPA